MTSATERSLARMRDIAADLWDTRDADRIAELRARASQVAPSLDRLARRLEGRSKDCRICQHVQADRWIDAAPSAVRDTPLSAIRALVPEVGSPSYESRYVACPECGQVYCYVFEWESHVGQAEPHETLFRMGLRGLKARLLEHVRGIPVPPDRGWTPSALGTVLDHIHAVVTLECSARAREAKGGRRA